MNAPNLHSKYIQLNLQSGVDLWWSDLLGDEGMCCHRK